MHETKQNKNYKHNKAKVVWFNQFLSNIYIDDIDRDCIDNILLHKEEEGCAPATINRYVSIVRVILRTACNEWRWINIVPKLRMRKEVNRRVRFLNKKEADVLIDELPEHLSLMARFSLYTGLRMTNVVTMKWEQVNVKKCIAFIYPEDSKNGEAIGVPLNSQAISVIKFVKNNHSEYLFTYKGKPVKRASTKAWYNACKRAGIENFRWHDWRHTWASWHAQEGTPLSVLQELGGWKTSSMVQRYAHLTVRHLLEHAERIT